jgi:glucosamine--fructose-6-phosphate aminotransferase (isomerizing)
MPRYFSADSLIVAVSQSGASVEIVRLLEVNQGRAPIVGITNTPESPLGRKATLPVFTEAGEESTVSCKTYLATLMALGWLGDSLCGKDPAGLRSAWAGCSRVAGQYLEAWESHMDELEPILRKAVHLYLTGRGPSLAAVGQGGLILKESTHHPAEGMSSAAFRHGPLEMVDSRTFVLVLSGEPKTSELNRNLAESIEEAGGRAGLVATDSQLGVFRLPATPLEWLPVLEILPVEMLTLALAALDGREAGKFERATKVTTTE